MNFCPDNFPRGTVCVIQVLGQEPVLFTVEYLVRNGPNSYCVVSKDPDPSGCAERLTYNITHVVEIKQRGNGPVLYDSGSYSEKLKKWVPRLTTRGLFERDLEHFSEEQQRFGLPKPKHSYAFFGPGAAVHVASTFFKKDQSMSEYGRMCIEHFVRGCTRRSFPEYPHLEWFVVPKKKFKRFVLQNLSRWLESPSVAQDREDADVQRMLEEDFDREMDTLDPYPAQERAEGSYYMGEYDGNY